MIILKIFIHNLVLVLGLLLLIIAKKDMERKWYPKIVPILEIIGGIILIIWSCTIHFVEV